MTSPKEIKYYDLCQHPPEAGMNRVQGQGVVKLAIISYEFTKQQMIIATIYWVHIFCQAPCTLINF